MPWIALTVAGAGCTALLDMPPPQLFDGGDASPAALADVGTPETRAPGGPDAAFDAAHEAAPDVELDVAVFDAALDQSADGSQDGVLCGSALSCGGSALPSCCDTTDDAGAPVFACVSSESDCSGYYVECANENDCPSTDICCHYNSAMRCETPGANGACPGNTATQACDPANAGECPAKQACTLHLTINGTPSPYVGCQ